MSSRRQRLTGKVNPSGKLAYTIPKKDTDTLITYYDEAWDRFEKENEENSAKQRDVAGSEVAQVYLGKAPVPKGIQSSKYALATGTRTIYVGASSDKLLMNKKVNVQEVKKDSNAGNNNNNSGNTTTVTVTKPAKVTKVTASVAKNKKKVTLKWKKVKKGKTYYYKVRAYKKASGTKVYGTYSAARKVKIRK